MAIFKLRPSCKDYLWGGSRLRTDYGVDSDLHPLAEAWVLSCHPDGPSTLMGGPEDGKTLTQYIAEKGWDILGQNCRNFDHFPVLTKLIDAKGDLSIQVHPDDEYALAHEHQYGKTEVWYILDCEPGAYLYYGFDHEISKEEFERRIRDNTLLEVLNAAPVHKGDVFYIPAGTLHAICHGIVLAEIQQSSNITYRIYDYGRLGADGKPRALHIAQALDVTKCIPPQAHDFGWHMAKCASFTVDVHENGFTGTAGPESFVSLLIVEGQGSVTCGGQTLPLNKGDSVFITADSGPFTVTGTLRTLCTRV